MDKLFKAAKRHFTESTGISTKDIQFKLLNDEDFENTVVAGERVGDLNLQSFHVKGLIVMRLQPAIKPLYASIFLDMLHELGHIKYQDHSEVFYNLLRQCGVVIGNRADARGYKREIVSKALAKIIGRLR